MSLGAQSHPTPYDPMDCSVTGSSVNGGCLGKNPGVGCHALLQEISPTQGSNGSPVPPALQVDSLPLSRLEGPGLWTLASRFAT